MLSDDQFGAWLVAMLAVAWATWAALEAVDWLIRAVLGKDEGDGN